MNNTSEMSKNKFIIKLIKLHFELIFYKFKTLLKFQCIAFQYNFNLQKWAKTILKIHKLWGNKFKFSCCTY